MRTRALSIVLLGICGLLILGCGRSVSRTLGKDHAQELELENVQQFISMSLRKDASCSGGDLSFSDTVKDITYIAKDGYMYTQEFTDAGILEGIIRWVPADENEDTLRTRVFSRWTGEPVNVKLPPNFKQAFSVTVHQTGDNETVKDLTYLSPDGEIYDKEYRDGLVDRHFEGWIKIKVKQ